jgi:hypothetical protein
MLTGGVGANGIPIIAGSGQGLGASIIASITSCPEEICGNGIDDDGDGLIDNADTDCTPPVIEYMFEHVSQVTTGGITVLDAGDFNAGPPSGGTNGTNNGGGHNSTGIGIDQPDVPGIPRGVAGPPITPPAGPPITPPAGPPITPPGGNGPPITPPAGPPVVPGHRANTMLDGHESLSVYPNPARSNSLIFVDGLDRSHGEWQVRIYSISGRMLGAQQVVNGRVELGGMDLPAGMYFLEFENGVENQGLKLMLTR